MADTGVVVDTLLNDPLKANADAEKGGMDAKLGVDMDEKREDVAVNGRGLGEDASSNAHVELEQHASENVRLVGETSKDVDHAHGDGEENHSHATDIAHETPLSVSHPQALEVTGSKDDVLLPNPAQEDSDPYGVDAISGEANNGQPPTDEAGVIEHTTTQVEEHPVMLEDLKPLQEGEAPATEEPAATPREEEKPTKTGSDANPYGIDKADDVKIPESDQSPVDHATTEVETQPVALGEVKPTDGPSEEPSSVEPLVGQKDAHVDEDKGRKAQGTHDEPSELESTETKVEEDIVASDTPHPAKDDAEASLDVTVIDSAPEEKFELTETLPEAANLKLEAERQGELPVLETVGDCQQQDNETSEIPQEDTYEPAIVGSAKDEDVPSEIPELSEEFNKTDHTGTSEVVAQTDGDEALLEEKHTDEEAARAEPVNTVERNEVPHSESTVKEEPRIEPGQTVAGDDAGQEPQLKNEDTEPQVSTEPQEVDVPDATPAVPAEPQVQILMDPIPLETSEAVGTDVKSTVPAETELQEEIPLETELQEEIPLETPLKTEPQEGIPLEPRHPENTITQVDGKPADEGTKEETVLDSTPTEIEVHHDVSEGAAAVPSDEPVSTAPTTFPGAEDKEVKNASPEVSHSNDEVLADTPTDTEIAAASKDFEAQHVLALQDGYGETEETNASVGELADTVPDAEEENVEKQVETEKDVGIPGTEEGREQEAKVDELVAELPAADGAPSPAEGVVLHEGKVDGSSDEPAVVDEIPLPGEAGDGPNAETPAVSVPIEPSVEEVEEFSSQQQESELTQSEELPVGSEHQEDVVEIETEDTPDIQRPLDAETVITEAGAGVEELKDDVLPSDAASAVDTTAEEVQPSTGAQEEPKDSEAAEAAQELDAVTVPESVEVKEPALDAPAVAAGIIEATETEQDFPNSELTKEAEPDTEPQLKESQDPASEHEDQVTDVAEPQLEAVQPHEEPEAKVEQEAAPEVVEPSKEDDIVDTAKTLETGAVAELDASQDVGEVSEDLTPTIGEPEQLAEPSKADAEESALPTAHDAEPDSIPAESYELTAEAHHDASALRSDEAGLANEVIISEGEVPFSPPTIACYVQALDDSSEAIPAPVIQPKEVEPEEIEPEVLAVEPTGDEEKEEPVLEEPSSGEPEESNLPSEVTQEPVGGLDQASMTEQAAAPAEEAGDVSSMKTPEIESTEAALNVPVEPAGAAAAEAEITDEQSSEIFTDRVEDHAMPTESEPAVLPAEESATLVSGGSQTFVDDNVVPPAAAVAAVNEAVSDAAEPSLNETEAQEVETKATEPEPTAATEIELDSTDAKPVQEDEAVGVTKSLDASLDNTAVQDLEAVDAETIDDIAAFSTTIPGSTIEVADSTQPLELAVDAVEPSSTIPIEDSIAHQAPGTSVEAVEEDDSHAVLMDDEQSAEPTEMDEHIAGNTEDHGLEEAIDGASQKVEQSELEPVFSQSILDNGEAPTFVPSKEQDAEGETTQTVKDLVEGEQVTELPTTDLGDPQVVEGVDLHAVDLFSATIAQQEPLEADKSMSAEREPEPAGVDITVANGMASAVGDADLSTADESSRLIVPETLELVSGDNTQATEEIAHADEEQPSTPAAPEEPDPHVSREDSSAGTHEQPSGFVAEAAATEESVPEVYVELPTPSAETFSEVEESITPDTKESSTALKQDSPSGNTGPESVNQTEDAPTVVIPEVSKSVERTEGESLTPKEDIEAGNETPTTVHEIDEAAATPTEPSIERPDAAMGEQSSDAVCPLSVGNVALSDVTEADVHGVEAHEDGAQGISSKSQSTDSGKQQLDHAVSTPDSALEYEPSEPSITIDVQEATTEASSESLEVDEADITHGGTRALAIDTDVQNLPERPKSPWTPSYSVTQQGPGISQPEHSDVHEKQVEIGEIPDSEKDQDENESLIKEPTLAETEIPLTSVAEQHDTDVRSKTPEITERQTDSVTPKRGKGGEIANLSLNIERPKSPYPPSYSVTQMGPDTEDDITQDEGEMEVIDPLVKTLSERLSIASPRNLDEEDAEGSVDGTGSEVASDIPEVPMTPRSDLGIYTPGFDSRSEISVASREPIPPDSPRLDPDEPLFPESAMSTPVGKAPTQKQTTELGLPTDGVESITPLPAPLVPAQLASARVPIVEKEAEVVVAEEPESEALQTIVNESQNVVDDDDKSIASDSMSRLTTDLGSDVGSNDGRLTTIAASEVATDIESEVGSSAFDGDVESIHPASSVDSMETDSWAQDTDVERVSQPEIENEDVVHVEAPSESGHSEPEVIEISDAPKLAKETPDSKVELHESPVVVATPRDEPISSEPESEFEAISNPGFVTSSKELSDSMSELSTIHDDSTYAGPVEDMPNIPSSVSQLAIPTLDEGSGAPTPRAASPTTTVLSLDSDARMSYDFAMAGRHTETDLTTADEADMTLAMPKINNEGRVESDTESIEPLDDDTVRLHLSDEAPSPAEPAEIIKNVDPSPINLSLKPLPELPIFPAIITPSEAGPSISPKTFPGSLVSVDEESSMTDFEPISPPLGVRRRLESTASSLVFPGAWVASPTLPERASLEVATGEFSRPPPGKISRNNSGTSPSPDTTPLVTPTTADDDKRRCVIM